MAVISMISLHCSSICIISWIGATDLQIQELVRVGRGRGLNVGSGYWRAEEEARCVRPG